MTLRLVAIAVYGSSGAHHSHDFVVLSRVVKWGVITGWCLDIQDNTVAHVGGTLPDEGQRSLEPGRIGGPELWVFQHTPCKKGCRIRDVRRQFDGPDFAFVVKSAGQVHESRVGCRFVEHQTVVAVLLAGREAPWYGMSRRELSRLLSKEECEREIGSFPEVHNLRLECMCFKQH
jgi:hypothetical protein